MEEGSSSTPRTLKLFPLHPSSPGSSSSSSPIQNASMVTPQKRKLPAKDNVAMRPTLLNLFPLRPSGPGSSSSFSPIQNASMVTPQKRELPAKDNMAMRPTLLNLFPLRPSGPGSPSSSSPIQNASMVTPQERELPAKDNVAMRPTLLNLFPLRPSGPGSSSSFSPIQNANMVTPQEVELPGKGPKRDRSSGDSTDKWKIKKKLTESDLGHLSRLMLPLDCLKTYVFPLMGEEMKIQVQGEEGMKVYVRDEDTGDEQQLVFRRWKSSGSFVLNCGWTKLFVKGRGLELGDEIGMLWDRVGRKFHFKVLGRASRAPGNPPT